MNSRVSIAWVVMLVILSVWEMIWKGLGLWRAGHRDDRNWFIAMLVINTVGILPIVYLYRTKAVDLKQ